MSEMDRGEGRGARRDAPWSTDAGPEPAWAEAIRRGRKARGDQLREVFATFADEDPASLTPKPPESREGDRP